MTNRKSRSEIGNHDRPGSLGLFKMAAPRLNGMFVTFQREKITVCWHRLFTVYAYGEEIARKRTQKGDYMTVGWVNDENISPITRNDNVALSLQFIPNFGLSLHFIPSLQSAVCILYLVCILYPVCSLHFVLTDIKKWSRCKKDYLTDFFKRLSYAIAVDSAFINFVNSWFSNPPRKFEILS